MIRAVLIGLCLLAAGCAREAPPPKAGPATPPPPSTAQTLVDGLTGRTAIRAGQKAKRDITRISERRDRDLEEVLGE